MSINTALVIIDATEARGCADKSIDINFLS